MVATGTTTMSAPVRVLKGALAGEHIARLRDRTTPPATFRTAAEALSTLVLTEAMATLDGVASRVRTPLEETDALRPERRVTLVPVLRAGLALMSPALGLLPDSTRVAFLGMSRNEETLEPTFYLERLPADIGSDDVVVLDVMLATGGSAIAALDAVSAAGVPEPNVRFACLFAAPEGIDRVHGCYPDIPITAAVVDRGLDEHGFIRPGLGDAGDRLYGAVE